jgi:ABC-type lipoprotein release transport system permease subunit
MNYLQNTRVFKLVAGVTPYSYGVQDGVCISEAVAQKNGIKLGDWITLDCNTTYGLINSLDYQVIGMYQSLSDFDSIYVYMTRENALEFLDQEPEYFQSARIYLNEPDQADSFAGKLDRYLMEGNNRLRAESINDSGQFYNTIAGFLKNLFSFFVVFLLLIIAIGIRSAVRMSLFERMREFGTLRAIGFNRIQNFFIIFFEILLLSLISLSIALVITIILILILGRTGIYIGRGAIAYGLGGESIYPVFVLLDTLTALLIISVFSFFAPLKPGLRICYQKITDLLAQNQKPGSAILGAVKIWFTQRRQKNRTAD